MKPKNSALAAGVGYTVSNILIKGINILTLPIFSRLMTTEEFGVFNVFVSYDAFLFVIVGMALHSSIRSANSEFQGEIDGYTASVSLVSLLNMSLLLAAVLLFGGTLTRLLDFSQPVLYLLILYATGSAITQLYNTRLSLDYSYRKYMLVALVNSLGNVLVSFFLILTIFRNQRDFGRILGATLVTAGVAAYMLADLYRKARPRFSRRFWRFGLKYSLPIVPHGISQVLLGQFDRVMISRLVSDSAAGIFSLAGNIKLILTVITTSVSSAWSTWFYAEMDGGRYDGIRTRAKQLCALYTILAVGLMAISPELVLLLGGREYEAAKYIAIPLVLDAFVLFLYDIVVCGEYYSRKTLFIMLGTMFAAVLNVILNYIFILRYGYIAAAYTTLAAYVCYLILHLIISRRLTGFCILPMKWLAVFSAIAVLMAAAYLVLMESLVLRWLLCALVVIPMALLLLRETGWLEKIINRLEKRG